MSKLPPGLYDLPITNEIARELRQLDRAQLVADERELERTLRRSRCRRRIAEAS